MYIVQVLIWPIINVLIPKDAALVLRQSTELIVSVLQLQIRVLDLVDLLFALLSVDLDPLCPRLSRDLCIVVEVPRAEPHRVACDDHEFAPQVLGDLLISLTSSSICTVIALGEKNDELAALG